MIYLDRDRIVRQMSHFMNIFAWNRRKPLRRMASDTGTKLSRILNSNCQKFMKKHILLETTYQATNWLRTYVVMKKQSLVATH